MLIYILGRFDKYRKEIATVLPMYPAPAIKTEAIISDMVFV
jgi:exonuclease I